MNCRSWCRSKSPAAWPPICNGSKNRPAPETESMSSWGRRAMAEWLACACMGSACFAPAWAVSEADLLPVDQAFALTASAPAANRIELRWKIADGYYLYRHRISVQADPAFQAGALQLPPGSKHHDEFFGDVQTYRQQLLATLPGVAGAASITLKVKYQ